MVNGKTARLRRHVVVLAWDNVNAKMEADRFLETFHEHLTSCAHMSCVYTCTIISLNKA